MTKFSEFKRLCPKCNKEIFYKSAKLRDDANIAGTGCFKCRPTKTKLTEYQKFERKATAKEYNKMWRIENKEKIANDKREYNKQLKIDFLNAYGNKCSCCGELEPKFLTLEHLKGRNETDKRPSGKKMTGTRMYMKAKKLGYPDYYTILCFNCNSAKGLFGFCPHTKNI
jgi:hypothetical protein